MLVNGGGVVGVVPLSQALNASAIMIRAGKSLSSGELTEERKNGRTEERKNLF